MSNQPKKFCSAPFKTAVIVNSSSSDGLKSIGSNGTSITSNLGAIVNGHMFYFTNDIDSCRTKLKIYAKSTQYKWQKVHG